jgi:hypothetical protein
VARRTPSSSAHSQADKIHDFHYCVDIKPQELRIPGEIKPVYNFIPNFTKVHFNIEFLSTYISSKLSFHIRFFGPIFFMDFSFC